LAWLRGGAGGPRRPGGAVILVVAVLVASTSCSAQDTRRISCFLIGSVQAGICPLPNFFTEDPLFTWEQDPHQAGLSLQERIRLDRLYFPRSRKVLLEKFDMVFFADPYIDHFTATQFGDLYYAFTQGGMPSYWSFGPAYGQVIQPSILNDVLPISDYKGYFHQPWRAVFRRDRDPVFTPFIQLGVERVPGEAYGIMWPREGSLTWADMQPQNLPWVVSWRPGGKEAGLAWVFADEFNYYWWGTISEARGANPYALDLMTNVILYSLGRPLLTDILSRRSARVSIATFRSEKLLVLSMMEWADKFGANTLPLSNRLGELDSQAAAAHEQYLDQEYDSVISTMSAISSQMKEITALAVHLKDQALFWVFISEWLVVTSAAIVAGLTVWTLMIRKKVYRPVRVTRLTLR